MAHKKYLSQMRSASSKAVFCPVLPRFAERIFALKSGSQCHDSAEMRQDEVINGSQMVVKLRGSYYRRVKEN